MSLRIAFDVCVNAPRERVFDVFEGTVTSSIVKGGGELSPGQMIRSGDEFQLRIPKRGGATEFICAITHHEKPECMAFRFSNYRQTIATEFRFRTNDAEAGSSTIVNCVHEIKFTGFIFRQLGKLLGRLIERQFRQQIQALKSFSESDARPLLALPRRGLWRLPQNNYRGLLEACAPGVHAAAMGLLLRHVKPEGSVLDLGAGSGAWLSRLHDGGFNNLKAVELDAAGFGFDKVEPIPLDLNMPFSEAFDSSFRLVTALEILEHMDSPRHFLHQIHSLLVDDGYALLTMPNIGHWAGRLRFLLRAEHIYFEDPDYAQRHISPVTDLHMRLMFREIGFRLVASTTGGTFDGPVKRIIFLPLALGARLFFGSRTIGDVSIYLVKKSIPEVGLLGRDSHYSSRMACLFAHRSKESTGAPVN